MAERARVGLVVDVGKRQLLLRGQPIQVHLSPQEFDLLHLLWEKTGEVCTSEEIYDYLWPEEESHSGRQQDLHQVVRHVRRKLQPHVGSSVIENIPRVGYRLGLEVREEEEEKLQASRRSTTGFFVGREQEMETLRGALEDVLSGRGRIVTLAGEPGIGKTRIAEELAAHAEDRDVQVLWGRCYEAQGVPPYWPWVQVIRSYVRGVDPDQLHSEMGVGAGDIAEVVSKVKEILPDLEPPPKLEAQAARFRLFDSITTFLKRASQTRPLVLMLEDLHWADESSLMLLQFLARELGESRLMVVGTYRDVEVSSEHPLANVLAEIHRQSHSERLLLAGLAQEDIGRYIELISGTQPQQALVEALHAHTEGNPLFVTEVVRLLAQEGELSQDPSTGSGRADQTEAWKVPQGVREVIGQRLNRLSDECNKALTFGAVIGREFGLEQLGLLVEDASEDRLLEVLDEALETRIIEELPQAIERYQFTHALIQETLSQRLSQARRIRLHARIAQALEGLYGDKAKIHAAELANHFANSSNPEDMSKAIQYGEMGAGQATSVYAYGDAVRLRKLALNAQERLNPGEKRTCCEMLFALGEAQVLAGQSKFYLDETGREALVLAEEIEEANLASTICILALQAIDNTSSSVGYTSPESAWWLDKADRWARPDTPARVWSDACHSVPATMGGDLVRGRSLALRALLLARRLNDPEALWWAGAMWIWCIPFAEDWNDLPGIIEEFAGYPRNDVSPAVLSNTLFALGHASLITGQPSLYQEFVRELEQLTRRSNQPVAELCYMGLAGVHHLLDGQMEEALAEGQRIMARGQELGSAPFAFTAVWFVTTRALIHLGKFDEAIQLLAPFPEENQLPQKVLCLAHQGQLEEATSILNSVAFGTEIPVQFQISLLEASVIAEHQDTTKHLVARLSDIEVPTTGAILGTCIDRHMGAAMAMLGEPQKAEGHYGKALKIATDMQFRPEIALVRLQLAELVLEHYPQRQDEASEHLNFTIPEFREMKMQPALNRATALLERLVF